MLVAIGVHFAAALALPAVARRWDRAAFAIGALVPASAFVLALTHLGGLPATESASWAPVVGLEFTVRLDSLAMLLAVLVTGIGAIVGGYFARYAEPGNPGNGRDAAVLVAFAGAMLGLVLSDDVLSLYLFWEITTVCSFLLVGGSGLTAAERRSARQALLVTTLGGLSLLLGLILLSTAAGTLRISEIIAEAPSGPAVTAGIALLLVGVFTKSAQLPFHPWLPAAMVAPTPVSAYLHAAAMVKAGVYLVARFDPAFADRPQWWVPLVVVGLWTMVLGGVLAMRQHDLKLLLAYGTVSQLGFLLVLLAVGTRVSALAGATMLLAHGLFKSALFLTVGAIDKQAGTRDLRELSGLGRRWPVLAVSAGLAAASMAGLPPLLGFVGKETALEAFTHGSVKDLLILTGIVAGSLLTTAYTVRFFVGAFGTRGDVEPITARAPGTVFTTAVALPAAASLLLGVWPSLTDSLAGGYADRFAGEDYHLALWHGVSLPLLLSAIILLGGYLLYRAAQRYEAPSGWVPAPLRAQQGYRAAVRGLDEVAQWVTARLQTGSLPTYLGIILTTVVVVPTVGLLGGVESPLATRAWSTQLQLPLALFVVAAALTLPAARRRLTAVLLTGVVGYGVGGLFLVYGAVDLALAQFLVETLTLVVFVLVLRRFDAPFLTERSARRWASWRKATIAALGGLFVAMFAVVFSSTREGISRAGAEYIARAESEAGATNVVTAILIDFRALDTVGEITVLLVAATGAASLGLLARTARGHRMPTADARPADDEEAHR
ncbi:multicomponent Na+:H+ antiporter subunit A [Saccharomonospora amisosensis]|uniref:Multicomponent Na+:H+ antiporter subunit A n=1 Tax=Saccharomonospora amisosensis TaxID=1128677 RepID=A0A7X5UP26_9PSEU|nr:hydrogen gas-evolving membrane-bound hydrogenase subunit E [Saccharomonospora amisosensis]NIJ11567.1 multicomponent Na+:H+ antiporter subunit A [Saccharomonospora amisosensis]